MKTSWLKTSVILPVALTGVMEACSPRIYRPPALGAEYQFDRGLPPAKKPSHLFDKKMEKDLAAKGTFQPHRHQAAPAKPTTNPGDSTRLKQSEGKDSTGNSYLLPTKNKE